MCNVRWLKPPSEVRPLQPPRLQHKSTAAHGGVNDLAGHKVGSCGLHKFSDRQMSCRGMAWNAHLLPLKPVRLRITLEQAVVEQAFVVTKKIFCLFSILLVLW